MKCMINSENSIIMDIRKSDMIKKSDIWKQYLKYLQDLQYLHYLQEPVNLIY